MEIQEKINQQRVRYIVDSYQLNGSEVETFDHYLSDLITSYPTPLVELALVETLLDSWLTVPLMRGSAFLKQAHQKLKNWKSQTIVTTLRPDQFHQITGLDPAPIFGFPERSSCLSVAPSL
ncbi:MAG: hypothetical protein KME16_12850 [Scytolyngbya sp. HA4215-MV1]|jgi:hypothetical protein|nr:hypothetical protein [Scytolyngbya sp. HA4215-MV1]